MRRTARLKISRKPTRRRPPDAGATAAPGGDIARDNFLDLTLRDGGYTFPTLSREEIIKTLHLPETDLKQTRFYHEVFAEGRDAARASWPR